jgi:hypothetical protein
MYREIKEGIEKAICLGEEETGAKINDKQYRKPHDEH